MTRTVDTRLAAGALLASARFPATEESAGAARQLLRDNCGDRFPAEALESLLLLVTELVSNAAAATAAPLELRVTCDDSGVLLVEVVDASPVVPQLQDRGVHAESGRGLWLVDALALAWGAVASPIGKVTWFTMQT